NGCGPRASSKRERSLRRRSKRAKSRSTARGRNARSCFRLAILSEFDWGLITTLSWSGQCGNTAGRHRLPLRYTKKLRKDGNRAKRCSCRSKQHKRCPDMSEGGRPRKIGETLRR